MTFVPGGWWRHHYLLGSGDNLQSVCGEVVFDPEVVRAELADYPTGEPCEHCCNGIDTRTGEPLAGPRAVRLRPPNDPETLWLARDERRLLSPCHRVPTHAAPGPLSGPMDDWRMAIDHICSTCGRVVDPDDCLPGAALPTRPEGME